MLDTGNATAAPNNPGPVGPSGPGDILARHAAATAPGAGAPAKRGRPAGSKNRAASEAGGVAVAGVPPVDLFTPDNTGRLVALPFDMAAAGSGCSLLRLDKDEKMELAHVGAVALNAWVKTDPRWVALSLFSLSLCGVAASKALAYSGWKQAQALKNSEKK